MYIHVFCMMVCITQQIDSVWTVCADHLRTTYLSPGTTTNSSAASTAAAAAAEDMDTVDDDTVEVTRQSQALELHTDPTAAALAHSLSAGLFAQLARQVRVSTRSAAAVGALASELVNSDLGPFLAPLEAAAAAAAAAVAAAAAGSSKKAARAAAAAAAADAAQSAAAEKLAACRPALELYSWLLDLVSADNIFTSSDSCYAATLSLRTYSIGGMHCVTARCCSTAGAVLMPSSYSHIYRSCCALLVLPSAAVSDSCCLACMHSYSEH
jgi:hypothetical protein